MQVESAWRWLCARDFASLLVSAPRITGRHASWSLIYRRLSKLETVRWKLGLGGKGTSPILQADRSNYDRSFDGTVLIRSGGKYFFVVAVLAIEDIEITDHSSEEQNQPGEGAAEGAESIEGHNQVALVAKWTKIRTRPFGSMSDVPGPKAYHSLTALPCGQRLVLFGGQSPGAGTSGAEAADSDVHILTFEDRKLTRESYRAPASPGSIVLVDTADTPAEAVGAAESTAKPRGVRSSAEVALSESRAIWARPTVTGEPPSPRRGHTALPLWSQLGLPKGPPSIAMVGGSRGASPISNLEICVLEVYQDSVRWSTVKPSIAVPSGRFFHEAFFTSPSPENSNYLNLVVFGGQQYGVTQGYLGAEVGKFKWHETGTKGLGDVSWEVEWDHSLPLSSGINADGAGPGVRRGHSSFVVGRKLVVFGGAADNPESRSGSQSSGGFLCENQVWVYDARCAHWYCPTNMTNNPSILEERSLEGQPPSSLQSAVGPATTDFSAGAERPSVTIDEPALAREASLSVVSSNEVVSNTTEVWTSLQLPATPLPRRGHSARLVCGRLVVSGGYDSEGKRIDDRAVYELCFC